MKARAEVAFRLACCLDVAVRKPGNVSLASPGHGMAARHFLDSARVAGPVLFQPGATVGARIEQAVSATRAVAGCNTNLGIVLLTAPLAAALEAAPDEPVATGPWQQATEGVLHALTRDDAAAAFRAIALAAPGGLGKVPDQDVHAPPTVTLRGAMALAAPRDRVAMQYMQAHDDVFHPLLNTLRTAWRQRMESSPPGRDGARAALVHSVQMTFLHALSHWPDSHVARKHGEATAQQIMTQARPWLARGHSGVGFDGLLAWQDWDSALKARGLNPGTSADLTVATLLVAALTDPDWAEAAMALVGAMPD